MLLSEKIFLRLLLAFVFVPVLFAALFNWIVDPYQFFHSPIIKGFNDQQIPTISSRVNKSYDVIKNNYDALIIGSSRGNDLKPHESWQGFKVFNMSINAGTFYEMYRYVQHAHAHYPLKRLVIGLDLMSFSAACKYLGQFDENRLLVTEEFEDVDPLLRREIIFRDISGLLGSKKAIEMSFEKMIVNCKDSPDHVKTPRDYHQAFIQTESNFMKKGGNWLNGSENRFEMFNPVSGYDPLATFEALAQFCYARGIDMKIFFSPVHARLLLGMFYVGLWDELETLKTRVHQINRRLAARNDRDPFDIWDFSTVNSYSQEAVPPLGQEMQWYHEASHFKPALADKLQTVITGVGDNRHIAADFGVLLSGMNEAQLREHNLKQLNLIRKYVDDHPADGAEVFSQAKQLGTLQQEVL